MSSFQIVPGSFLLVVGSFRSMQAVSCLLQVIPVSTSFLYMASAGAPVHTKTRNKLGQAATSWNQLELAAKRWNQHQKEFQQLLGVAGVSCVHESDTNLRQTDDNTNERVSLLRIWNLEPRTRVRDQRCPQIFYSIT